MLNQRSLVLESVTLAQMVKLVVKVLVDLAAGTVLDQETTEDSKAAHPYNLAITHQYLTFTELLGYCIPWHTSISRTLSLTKTTVSTNSASSCELTGAGSGVHGDGLADDEAICDELSDGLAGVGVGDFAGLIGVEPDLALSAADDGRRQALLGCEVDPIERRMSAFVDMEMSQSMTPCRSRICSLRVVPTRVVAEGDS
jgi:hypothetical protein